MMNSWGMTWMIFRSEGSTADEDHVAVAAAGDGGEVRDRAAGGHFQQLAVAEVDDEEVAATV